MAHCGIPLRVLFSPTSAVGVPVLDYSRDAALHRCSGCTAYLNEFCQIDASAYRWRCPLCQAETLIPPDFREVDAFASKTELCAAVYDILAPRQYTRMQSGPIFLFVFDMSDCALSLDFTQQMIRSIRSSLSALSPAARVGVVTMSDRLTIFDLLRKSELVLSDLDDLEIVFPFGNVCPRLKDCKANLAETLDILLAREPPAGVGNCIGSALFLCEKLLTKRGGLIVAG
jgi:hypothetical protein